ncbi:RpiR family transcriptional regulator, partial [Clostridioides difficile]
QMHPSYKLTMLYFILIELLFIKYSIYKRHRMITEGIDCKL